MSRQGASAREAVSAAFFDVDETLLSFKTMSSFLCYRRGRAPASSSEAIDDLLRAIMSKRSREVQNALFYRVFRGESWDYLMRLGEDWFVGENVRNRLNSNVMALLDAQRHSGAAIVLVSGSFAPCLQPLSSLVGADALICTTPVVQSGRLTGETSGQVIGEAKALAVREWCTRSNVDLRRSAAFGDDVSDLPLLELVGLPIVVQGSPALAEIAHFRGWRVVRPD